MPPSAATYAVPYPQQSSVQPAATYARQAVTSIPSQTMPGKVSYSQPSQVMSAQYQQSGLTGQPQPSMNGQLQQPTMNGQVQQPILNGQPQQPATTVQRQHLPMNGQPGPATLLMQAIGMDQQSQLLRMPKPPPHTVKGSTNKVVQDGPDLQRSGGLHIIICGIDYSCCAEPWGGSHALDTKPAFDFMVELADRSGALSKMTLWNKECTKQNIAGALRSMGQRLQPGDTFVFYYTGHGDTLPDQSSGPDKDEDSGRDQALCTLGVDGQAEPRAQVWTRDDDLSRMMTQFIPKHAKILIIADCCHSGTIMDMGREQWAGYEAISLAGCTDTQTSAGTGHGGQFSRAITAAIESLQTSKKLDCGVSRMYNKVLEEYQRRKTASHTQNITIHGTGILPKNFPWPLVPTGQYVSPVHSQPSGSVLPSSYVDTRFKSVGR
mmetsp:Transcript_41429/g.90398  ORF Transcript_41429/g.90398 Transcript_41429/m.90398 type:complete len:435 (+) Transcript_41429:83-1387(+)